MYGKFARSSIKKTPKSEISDIRYINITYVEEERKVYRCYLSGEDTEQSGTRTLLEINA